MRFIRHLILILFTLVKLSAAQKLLLLFLDGFRWDYIKDTNLVGISEMKRLGAYISKVIPVFPADCHPNIYSIFTGLYPQHHGVIGNKVYSSKSNVGFNHNDAIHRRNVHAWVDAEPLWITSKKQGKRSFLYHLPTCESSFGPLSPSYCVPYDPDGMSVEGLNRSVADAVRSLRSDVAHLAVVYYDELDRLTHSYGPDSARLSQQLLPSIDQVIQWTLGAIRGTDVHLVVLSDHGMAQIAAGRQVYLERIVWRSEIELVINQGGYAGLWPKAGCFDKVYRRLMMACKDEDSHFQVYTHKSMPSHWNAYVSHLSPPLLMVAEPGYFISSDELEYPSGNDFYDSGWHGYAPESEDMASPLLAYGPLMQPGSSMDVANVTELYQFLAHLIDVVPLSHNGSSQFLSAILRHYHHRHMQHGSINNHTSRDSLLLAVSSSSSSSMSISSIHMSLIPHFIPMTSLLLLLLIHISFSRLAL